MKEILSVKQLSKSYSNKKVVDHVNISVKKGEIFGLLGPNGAGKSTTIECMLGIKELDSGSVSILQMNPKKDRKRLFEKVGVQFQEANYQEKLKVKELCEMTASFYKHGGEYKSLLNQFELKQKENNFIGDLSGGEKQRLFILLALIPNPEIVFLDELTTGLDTFARRELWKYLIQLKNNGLTIFLTSHFMDEVEVLCDRIMILKKGQTVFCGSVDQALSQSPYEDLEEAYLWYTKQGVSL